MLLKITKYKKILVIVFVVVILLGGYYKFVFIPQVNKIYQLNLKNEEYERQIKEEEKTRNLNKKLVEEIRNVNKKINISVTRLFPNIDQEKFIVLLDDMISKTGIKCNNINFSEVSIEKVSEEEEKSSKESMLETLLKEYKALRGQKQDNSTEENAEDKKTTDDNNKDSKKVVPEAEKMSITIAYEGTYENVMKFIDEIKAFDKRIIIKDISLGTASSTDNNNDDNDNIINNYVVNDSYTENNGEVSGNIVLEFYAVPKFADEEDDYLKWEFNNDYGKQNPFKK